MCLDLTQTLFSMSKFGHETILVPRASSNCKFDTLRNGDIVQLSIALSIWLFYVKARVHIQVRALRLGDNVGFIPCFLSFLKHVEADMPSVAYV